MSPMIRRGFVIGVCAASFAAPPRWASAEPVGATAPGETHAHPAAGRAYLCVDLSDGPARPRFQGEPCKLPMVQLPRSAAPASEAQARWETRPPGMSAPGGGHAMFWRFPVQVDGPYGAPRHGWR